MKTPRVGSSAKAWTDVMIPDRTRKVPSSEKPNVRIESRMVQLLSASRFSTTSAECKSAVPISHGMKEAFSTGSQNHQPPQPSSLYAHHDPSAMPPVKAVQDKRHHGRTQRAQAASTLPSMRAATANENTIEKPT